MVRILVSVLLCSLVLSGCSGKTRVKTVNVLPMESRKQESDSLAWQQNPAAFGDHFEANGDPGKNGIPDILDEAKWGLDWLVKMNPAKGVLFNQVADDRDHVGFRLPNRDSVHYGIDLQRPVYYCSGKPQGLFKYKNQTTGIASTAGKYASAFALGSRMLEKKGYRFSTNFE
ncbi:MAG: glycoside hydrolase family 9 protein [Bacteroidales bacterium]|nr:glycoside hydrolase family 9 protein [Bacteroidales bacterium]